MEKIIFGPVPSRRLGRSLGVNNIPHKVCSYSCVYCQVGKAIKMQYEPQAFYSVDVIVGKVKQMLKCLKSLDLPDYITIVPDGEPTLDISLCELIKKLKTLGFPVAVITNSSLIDREEVQTALKHADYVSIKVDTVNPALWKKINNPHKYLSFKSILKGIADFSQSFRGKLVTETMLIKNLNDAEADLENLATYLARISPETNYIAIPTRPPAYEGIHPADETSVALAFNIFTRYGLSTELLTGYEGNAFASTGNFKDDILSITAVHPMRMDAVMELMVHSGATENNLKMLIDSGLINQIHFNNQDFFIRNFTHKNKV